MKKKKGFHDKIFFFKTDQDLVVAWHNWHVYFRRDQYLRISAVLILYFIELM